ncbi:spindle assembly protein [Planoprotostelium fungivorum]|uniref:Spindle assembly protein n=1 Tax=Planoprotostelium fungivorum TaxID=1890364 RepID=A0A2P6NN77_9EUKA|nr:spindle assembly protein [Planoprotostelium fungivorum]
MLRSMLGDPKNDIWNSLNVNNSGKASYNSVSSAVIAFRMPYGFDSRSMKVVGSVTEVYHDTVPVWVNDKVWNQLTFSITVHPKKLIDVQITDESEPLFLNHLSVSEADFQNLKRDQNLHVDFSAFPKILVDLLELCRNASTVVDSNPFTIHNYGVDKVHQCHLNGEVLAIVEPSKLRHLTHLSLQMRAANDLTLKKHLCDRVIQFRTLSGQLKQQLEDQTDSFHRQLNDINSRLEESQRQITSNQSEIARRIAEEKEKSLKTERELTVNHEKDKRERETLHHAQMEQLREKCEALSSERDTLLTMLRSQNQMLLSQTQKMRQEGRPEDGAKIVSLQQKIFSLNQQVNDKDITLQTMSEHLNSAANQNRQLEDAIAMRKEKDERYQKDLSDLRRENEKLNQIIDRISAKFQTLHTKYKSKQALIKRQDEIVQAKQQEYSRMTKDIGEVRQQLADRSLELERITRTNDTLKRQAEEDKTTITKNMNVKFPRNLDDLRRQTIQYLNEQMNEHQSFRNFGYPSSSSSISMSTPSFGDTTSLLPSPVGTVKIQSPSFTSDVSGFSTASPLSDITNTTALSKPRPSIHGTPSSSISSPSMIARSTEFDFQSPTSTKEDSKSFNGSQTPSDSTRSAYQFRTSFKTKNPALYERVSTKEGQRPAGVDLSKYVSPNVVQFKPTRPVKPRQIRMVSSVPSIYIFDDWKNETPKPPTFLPAVISGSEVGDLNRREREPPDRHKYKIQHNNELSRTCSRSGESNYTETRLIEFSKMGLPWNHKEVPPHLQETIKNGLEHLSNIAKDAGFDYTFITVTPGEDPSVLHAALKAKPFAVVCIGFGVRSQPQLTELFEKAIEGVRTAAPQAKLVFNTSPDTTLNAFNRGFSK